MKKLGISYILKSFNNFRSFYIDNIYPHRSRPMMYMYSMLCRTNEMIYFQRRYIAMEIIYMVYTSHLYDDKKII